MRPLLLQVDCTQPLHDMLINNTVDWIPCSHATTSGGPLVVGVFMYGMIFNVIFNWTESIYPPFAWTAVSAGLIFAYLPGDLLMRVVSFLAIIVATVIVVVWQSWKR